MGVAGCTRLVAQPAGLMLGFAVHLVTSAALGGVLFRPCFFLYANEIIFCAVGTYVVAYRNSERTKTHVIVAGLTCGGPFPGPGSSSEHRVSMNPMHEFIHHDDSQL